MKQLLLLILLTVYLVAFGGQARAADLDISLNSFATGLAEPVDITNTGVGGDDRLFVVERAGVIKIVEADGDVVSTPFLDISSRVGDGGGEEGLLGLAFHPHYNSTGFFYVYYTNNSGDIVVSRFTRSAGDANVANSASEQITLTTGHPGQSNHNGGDLNFGPHDGNLYIAVGDGGGAGDTANNAQNKDALLGKILRINLNGDAFPADALRNYVIPDDNPFKHKSGADEVWAMGLRNPWRFSFDRVTKDMYIGDVGQGSWEEVNIEPFGSIGGKNYGWRCYEGDASFNTSGCSPQSSYDGPVGKYSLSGTPCAVTGGFVYRGNTYNALQGHFVFADYCSGDFYTLTPNPLSGFEQRLQTTFSGRNISSFGENINGEIFASDISNGTIYEVQENSNPTTFDVYRMSNWITRERLLTSSLPERDLINHRNGWGWEGVTFKTATSNAVGAVPIYRLANFNTRERLFTPSAAERDAINGQNGWVAEGTAFYGLPDSGSTKPVYRMANWITKERLFTTNATERDAINGKNGWVFEGTAWFAPF